MTTRSLRATVLVVDDDDSTRHLLVALLKEHGYRTEGVDNGEAALQLLARDEFDLVLLDVQMPGMGGVDVLVAGQSMAPGTEFIMITAFGSIDTAVDAMKRGAYDYLRKPLRTEELLLVVERALADTSARRDMARLKRKATEGIRERLVGRSRAMEALWDRIEKVAPTRATVLITGETGTGKELVAHAIHELSPRSSAPAVVSNCSSLSETLLESELFGHVKGSFTGAVGSRRGLFEEANRSTLFLDEVSALSPGIQVKLLRVVQERVIQRVGSNTPIPLDLRLIAATNVDLAVEVARGTFREDLFYRLNVYPLRVPPLRERRDDIPLLARHFLLRAAERNGLTPPDLPAETLRDMSAHPWPGNVRQLENFIESAVINDAGSVIRFAGGDLPPVVRPERDVIGVPMPSVGRRSLADDERTLILDALARTHGHRGRAAELLGIDRRTIDRKLKRYQEEALATTG